MAAPTADQKLSRALAPSFDALYEKLKVDASTNSTEIMLTIQALGTRIELIERQLAERKKTIGGKAKAPTDGTPGATPPVGATFAATKMVYFKQKFKAGDPAWMAKYVPAAVTAGMDADPGLQSRTGEAKVIAQANFAYNWLRLNDKQMIDVTLTADFAADKAAHEASLKPAQQQADAPSPK